MNIHEDSIRLITYNILYDYGDNQPYSWKSRRDDVFPLLRFHAPDVFCLQEPLHHQVVDLADNFVEYDYLTAGCGDGELIGQHMTIFYLSNKFELIDSGMFGLSETPEKLGVVGWDAKNPRLALWVKLIQKSTDQTFYVVNTHLDHIGEMARQQSALFLCKNVKEIAGSFPVIVCGDFNANQESQTYKNMIDNGFTDCSTVPDIISYDLPYTYHRYLVGKSESEIEKFKDDPRVFGIIDHIFYTGTIKALRHGTLGDNITGTFPSDHLPKVCDFLLEAM